jgi:hypothetical protein
VIIKDLSHCYLTERMLWKLQFITFMKWDT